MKKIAVIGFGFMGVVHAKNIIRSQQLKLCGIVDCKKDVFDGIGNAGNLGKFDFSIERLQEVPVYKSLEECCQKEMPDAVCICVPLFLHYEMTKKAIDFGLDVLLEKPFCSTLEEGRELIRLAQERQKILMVAHCVRFSAPWQFLLECIRDERYGKLKLLSTNRIGGEPTWGVWRDTKVIKSCGGSIMDLLIHDIDFAHYCLGAPSVIKTNLHREEYWELQFNYRNDTPTVSIKGGFLHRHSAFSSEYAANFEHAGIRYNTLEPQTVYIGTDAGATSLICEGDMYSDEMEYFAACIEKRTSPLKCLPEESLKAVGVCHKIMQ